MHYVKKPQERQRLLIKVKEKEISIKPSPKPSETDCVMIYGIDNFEKEVLVGGETNSSGPVFSRESGGSSNTFFHNTSEQNFPEVKFKKTVRCLLVCVLARVAKGYKSFKCPVRREVDILINLCRRIINVVSPAYLENILPN